MLGYTTQPLSALTRFVLHQDSFFEPSPGIRQSKSLFLPLNSFANDNLFAYVPRVSVGRWVFGQAQQLEVSVVFSTCRGGCSKTSDVGSTRTSFVRCSQMSLSQRNVKPWQVFNLYYQAPGQARLLYHTPPMSEDLVVPHPVVLKLPTAYASTLAFSSDTVQSGGRLLKSHPFTGGRARGG